MHAVITTCFAYWENTQNKLEIDIARLRLNVTNVCIGYIYIRSVFSRTFLKGSMPVSATLGTF